MTLVEVMAGLAIMGTLVTGLLVATGRLKAQDLQAQLRLEACQVADDLLTGWWSPKEDFPRTGNGTVRRNGNWRWRTRPIRSNRAERMGAQVVALEVFPIGTHGGAPVARVDVLLPEENDAPQGRTDTD